MENSLQCTESLRNTFNGLCQTYFSVDHFLQSVFCSKSAYRAMPYETENNFRYCVWLIKSNLFLCFHLIRNLVFMFYLNSKFSITTVQMDSEQCV